MHVPLTVADFLERGTAGFSDAVAIIDEADQPAEPVGTLTFGDLARRVRAWQAGFDRLNVGTGERVAVVSHNSTRLLELLYAVPASGRICVPINFRLAPREIEYIVNHCGASVLLVDPELDSALTDVKAPHRFVLGRSTETDLMRFDIDPVEWATPSEDSTATINYTSGTTARPKGVEITHRNLWLNATTLALHTRAWERDIYLHTLPMFHCNGWGMPFAMAGLGAKQIVLRKIDGPEILRRVEKHGVTLMSGAPAVWNAVLEAAQQWPGELPGRGRVRLLCGGAPPPSRMIAQLRDDLGWELHQIYGLTETSPLLTFNRSRPSDDALDADERARRMSRAGLPALGARIRISDSGEVQARSNVVMQGYWNDPDATDAAVRDGWFHTGDGGVIDADGHLTISDRQKDVIVTGGENVSSIEVEDCIFSHPAVAQVAIIGVPDPKWGETVKALVVVAEGASVTESEIIAHCKERLARYKAPTSVEIRESIPVTATGKIQKFRLREPYWKSSSRSVN